MDAAYFWVAFVVVILVLFLLFFGDGKYNEGGRWAAWIILALIILAVAASFWWSNSWSNWAGCFRAAPVAKVC